MTTTNINIAHTVNRIQFVISFNECNHLTNLLMTKRADNLLVYRQPDLLLTCAL